LHVIEHIGLGRYGDPIDPNGSIKACKELQRVLKPNGTLYISLPIGKPRICFNAHRVHDPREVIEYFNKLDLVEFSVVDDAGDFVEKVSPNNYAEQSYACGMYVFKKKKK